MCCVASSRFMLARCSLVSAVVHPSVTVIISCIMCCHLCRIWSLYEMSQQDHVENSAAEHGLDGCHSNMSPSSPNGQPFRVPGRRTRTTSEYVHCLLLHRVVSLHNSNKYCQTPNYIYMSHLLAGITHTYETMVLVSFGEVIVIVIVINRFL